MERDTSRHGSLLLRPHSQLASPASDSLDQNLGIERHTAGDDGSISGAHAPINHSQTMEMEEPHPVRRQSRARHSTELK